MAQEEHPDVIMLDVVMPEVSGWEVLAELRADPAFSRTPVIVCTAYVAEAMGRLAELKGPDQHLGLLPKPFELEELIEVVGSVTRATLIDADGAARAMTWRRSSPRQGLGSTADTPRLSRVGSSISVA